MLLWIGTRLQLLFDDGWKHGVLATFPVPVVMEGVAPYPVSPKKADLVSTESTAGHLHMIGLCVSSWGMCHTCVRRIGYDARSCMKVGRLEQKRMRLFSSTVTRLTPAIELPCPSTPQTSLISRLPLLLSPHLGRFRYLPHRKAH